MKDAAGQGRKVLQKEVANNSTRQRYVIGFTVHEAKELSRDGVALDPLCVVRALGREYQTELKRGKLHHAKFNESYIWNDVYLTEDEFKMSHIDFELQAAMVWSRNEKIGSANVQLAMVRRRPNHTSAQKWLQLSNAAQLTAKLKVTVFCYGQGDEPPRPEDFEHDTEETERHLEDLGAAVLGDAANKGFQDTQAYHLFVQVHRAEHLGGGTEMYNSYVTVEFNGHRLESPALKENHTFMFAECFRIPVTMPILADSVLIRVWDKKKWQSDNIIVQGRLSFSLLRMHALQPKWFNFYGFSKTEVGSVATLTSQGEVAEENAYMGRLLISARVQKVARVDDLFKADIIKGKTVEEPPASSLTFALDVLEISGCAGREAYVEMSMGNKSKASKHVKRVDYDTCYDAYVPGRFRYGHGEGRVAPLVVVVPTDTFNQLDMILSIYSKLENTSVGTGTFQRVGFMRMKISNIKDWKGETAPPVWVPCRPMAHLPSSIEPGSILLSLAKSHAQIKERGMPRVKPLRFELRCYICMARGLVSESQEAPNPFCQVSCAGSLARTKTVECTTAPSWGQCLKLSIELQRSLDTLKVQPEPIQVVVYDEVGTVLDGLASGLARAATMEGVDALDLGAPSLGQLQTLGATLGAKAMTSLQDTVGDLTGDTMAKKRLGAVVNGRRVIGRMQVNLQRILRPPVGAHALEPKWIKLKGGLLGLNNTGDILVAFEMMKSEYTEELKVLHTSPQGKTCTLSVALLGLRDVVPVSGRLLERPKLQVLVPMPSGQTVSETIKWSTKPSTSLSADDVNRRWTTNNHAGFEFLSVINLDIILPRSAVFEPSMLFRLLDGENRDAFLAEGRVSLAESIPWVKPAHAKQAVEAQDHYEGGMEDCEDGILVSDGEGDGEDHDATRYVETEISAGTAGIAFNATDEKSFPPVVTSLVEGSKAHRDGVQRGNWLVGYKKPTDNKEQPAAHWSPAKAAKLISQVDQKQEGALVLRFRSTGKAEVFVRLVPGQLTGLAVIEDPNIRPPKISKDLSKEKTWSKHGIGSGWRIADINGFDTKAMSSCDTDFVNLLSMRPIVVTCRPHVSASVGEGSAEMGAEVMLSGVPSAVKREHDHMMKHRDGCMAFTTVPRPSLLLPQVTDSRQLNMFIARAMCMDVRGVIKHIMSGKVDGDDTRTRPSVPGRLEENMEQPTFAAVSLMKGLQVVGRVKLAYKVVFPKNRDWVHELKDPSDPDRSLFEEPLFRRRYKQEQPSQIRVRTYIIRGLNVSGANSGYGNPYLFFRYGQDQVRLDGYRQMNTVEPRFFRTEERDIHLPEQGHFEVGLYDWQDGNEDQLIGRSIVDLEDRWFTPTFQAYMKQNKVPIEYRPLQEDPGGAGGISKGSLEMWIEVIDATTAAEMPTSTLVQPPAVEVEIRAAVFTVRNMSRRLCLDENGYERERVDILVRCSIDCRTYLGPQQREQETDIHFGSEGSGEFNWRFVFSRIAVTQGVPLDCFLQFSIWEHFALQRPQLICENLVEMKNYCKKVSSQGEFLQIEAELPLENKQLSQLLMKEMEGKFDDAEGAGDGESEDSGDDEQAALQGGRGADQQQREIPPAAFMQVLVQVVPQTQASTSDMRVGQGRDEPNRNPILSFPKSGRTWEAVLPVAAQVIEGIIDNFSSAKRRCGMLVMLSAVILVVALLHFVKDKTSGCPYIQTSCRLQYTCKACACCHHMDKLDSTFCYYSFLGSADKVCSATSFQDFCNIKHGNCSLPSGSCTVEDTCFKTPRPKVPVRPAKQR